MRWLTLPKQISDRALYAILLALCIPAFWINLGVMPFIGDEGIRATVALEMHLSGNYILPTLSGEPYFNKPPLYNWILLASYHLFGYFGEIPSRNTTLFFLFLFAFTAFFHIKKEFGAKAGWLAAFMLVTSGRILFWDAMLGLIDMCFSWLVYLNWMLLYSQGKRKKWLGMFVLSYLITAACFLLKGLPAVVFQVFSIPTALILFGQWKRLFYWQHFLGAAVGLLAAGSYYAVYASQVSLEKAFAILLDQSLQRTVTHYGISDTVLHLFTFPFEQVYHFLPWSLLLLFVFHPKCWKTIHSRPFVRFNFWMMAVNLPVYWSSVEVYPRYLLMFVPLFNIVFWYVYEELRQEGSKWPAVPRWIYTVIGVALVLALFAVPFIERVHQLDHFYFAWASVLSLALIAAWGILADPARVLLWTVAVVLVVRIGLNLFILPFRAEEARFGFSREHAERVVARYPDRTWYLYKGTTPNNTARFYLENETRQIIQRTYDIDSGGVYLVYRPQFPEVPVAAKKDSVLLSAHDYLEVCVFDQ